MSEQHKKNEKNFLIQGSILAIAGVITKLIGAFYRIPLLNIIGTEGNGYYSVAFSIYSVALMLTSYSLPLAVSKLVRQEWLSANIKMQTKSSGVL